MLDTFCDTWPVGPEWGLEVFMRYTKRIGLFVSALLLMLGTFVVSSSAQIRGRVIYRPVIVHRHWGFDPFWRSSVWYDPYWSDPYVAHEREKYYREEAVKDARKDLAKHREKYSADGVITAKEQEKLDKEARKYSKAMQKLNEFRSDSD